MVSTLKRDAYRMAKRVFARVGFDLTRRHFYSPIPQTLPADWDTPRPMRGIRMDLDEQLRWLERSVAPTAHEFIPPVRVAGDYNFVYENGAFGHGDADVLYGVIRNLQPARIVELGSGHSSVVIRLALERNQADGKGCDYRVFDPYPTDHLVGTGAAALNAEPIPAEQVPDSVFEELRSGDVLFVDTTHTVKIGNDVLRIVLDALPLLAKGVIVHFHDIFLPYEYPSSFFVDHEFYWAEQYLLQAFLAFNPDFELCACLHALARQRKTELATICPAAAGGNPASLWLRRC